MRGTESALPWFQDPEHALCIRNERGNIAMVNLGAANVADVHVIVHAVNRHAKLVSLLVKASQEMTVARGALARPGRVMSPTSLALYDKVLREIEVELRELRLV